MIALKSPTGYSGTENLEMNFFVEFENGKKVGYSFPTENRYEVDVSILGYSYFIPARTGRSYEEAEPAEGETQILYIKFGEDDWSGALSDELKDHVEHEIDRAVRSKCYPYKYHFED